MRMGENGIGSNERNGERYQGKVKYGRRRKDRESGEEKKKATGDGRDEMAVRVASIHESGDPC